MSPYAMVQSAGHYAAVEAARDEDWDREFDIATAELDKDYEESMIDVAREAYYATLKKEREWWELDHKVLEFLQNQQIKWQAEWQVKWERKCREINVPPTTGSVPQLPFQRYTKSLDLTVARLWKEGLWGWTFRPLKGGLWGAFTPKSPNKNPVVEEKSLCLVIVRAFVFKHQDIT